MPAIRPGTKGGVISGWGTALPEKVLTNHELAEMMDTSDEWIVRRAPASTSAASAAARSACRSSRAARRWRWPDSIRSRIDALVLATTTPDKQWGNAAAVQNELGMRCGAFDVNAACSGFVYGLVTGHGLIAMGADRVLVIGTDTLSRITDWDDRGTAPLFADGSGAVVIESVDGPGQLLGLGSRRRRLAAVDPAGRGRRLHPHGGQGGLPAGGADHGRLGREVDGARRHHRRRRRADRPPPGQHPHHRRRLRTARHPDGACCGRARPDREHVIGLDPAGARPTRSTTGRVAIGDLVLMVGFGGGMTAASCVLRWGGGLDD